MTDTINRQLELEREMIGLGAAAYEKRTLAARQNGKEDETDYGRRLLNRALVETIDTFKAFIAQATNGKAGKRNRALMYLEMVPVETAAFIALRAVLEGVTSDRKLQAVAVLVGQAIEDEVRFSTLEANNPELWQKLQTYTRRSTSTRHTKKVFTFNETINGIEWENWPKADCLHLGMKCIDLVIEATGYAQVERVSEGRNNTMLYLRGTEATLIWIDERCSQSALLCPHYMPMVHRPNPWTGPLDGGYLSAAIKPLPIVKGGRPNFIEELGNRVDQMPAVYRSINALQDTAWRINTRILEVMEEAWERGHAVGKLPARDNAPLPARPQDIDTNKEALKAWKKEAAKVHEVNNKSRSRRLQAVKTMWIAKRFKDEAELFFPYQLDFRGRIYAVPNHLNPQSVDYSKALLTFATGKPLTNGVAAGWLAIHGANLYGYDKAALEDRVTWVEDRNEDIKAVAADPWGNPWWTEADKPWQFLAFCFEWAGFLTEGWGYVSCLPVAMDGSNNGLQNFAAMLRDPVSGAAVNLVPSDTPSDIYQKVADVVIENISGELSTSAYAETWIDIGVNRKMTKRPVMTLPYGATIFSCRSYVSEYVKETVGPGADTVFGEGNLWEASQYMASHTWSAIGQVVVAAREAMSWLQKAARLAGAEGLPVNWTTPTGFPVMQCYYKSKAHRIKTRLGESITYLTLREELPEIDKHRQASGISPNFVHSMDSTHLMLSVCLAVDNDVTSFAMIHDSYGTHAADTEMLAACLRHAFVDLYKNNDVLANFREEIVQLIGPDQAKELPPIPAKGSLDLDQVKESTFFFA